LKADFVKGAAQQGLSNVVTFHGHRQDIPNCIAALDAVLMCSDHEGTPMVALETLALGVPLVGHNVGGLSEILHKYPDFRVDDHQAEAYAQHLRQICCPELAVAVSLDEQYTAVHNLFETLALYEALCG
jgi:glycosyltransferase involved in cell wall biosynthesis